MSLVGPRSSTETNATRKLGTEDLNLHYQSQNLACCQITPVPSAVSSLAASPSCSPMICLTHWREAIAALSSDRDANICSMSEVGDKVVQLHLQGVRSIAIAHELDVAQSTVHYHLRKHAQQRAPAEPRVRRSPTAPRAVTKVVRTQELVGEHLSQGVSRIEISRRLNITKSAVSYHARRLGEAIDERCRRRYEWGVIQAFYDEGNSLRDCRREFGFSNSAWRGAVKRGAISPRPGFRPIDEIFAVNTRRNRGHLKQRLLLMLRENRCERCGIREWRDRPLAMALHHINGDRLDNRLENLELLCPNCHSQTENYGGRNGRRNAAA